MILVVEGNRLQSVPPIHHMINRRLKFQTGFSWHASLFVNPPGKSKKQELPHFCPLSLSFLPLPSVSDDK